LQKNLTIGSLDSQADWGYAGDYVAAMWSILQLAQPQDFVIATGQLHTVRDLVDVAFQAAGLRWEDYVVEDPSLLRETSGGSRLCGDAGELRRLTGWSPRVSFEEMIREMVAAEKVEAT
jgi:GDPmannose 4,6-dehydratase